MAKRPPKECVCFRGVCWTEDGLFGKGQGQRVRFGRRGKFPKTFFERRLSPLFLADKTDYFADTGADEQESAEKDKPGTTRPRERV